MWYGKVALQCRDLHKNEETVTETCRLAAEHQLMVANRMAIRGRRATKSDCPREGQMLTILGRGASSVFEGKVGAE